MCIAKHMFVGPASLVDIKHLFWDNSMDSDEAGGNLLGLHEAFVVDWICSGPLCQNTSNVDILQAVFSFALLTFLKVYFMDLT